MSEVHRIRAVVPTTWPRTALLQSRAPRDAVPLHAARGELPADLHGHLWLLAPAGATDAVQARHDGRPVFHGEGRLWRVDLHPAGVVATARVPTGLDAAADRAHAVAPAHRRFHDAGLVRASPQLGVRAFTNTAIVPVRLDGSDRLLLTGDASVPLEIDPATLAPLAPLGHPRSWQAAALPRHAFPLVLTTSHPIHDPDTRALISVCYGRTPGNTFARLLRWDASGARTWGLVDPAGRPATVSESLHQLAYTRDWLVLCDTNFKVGPDQFGAVRRLPAALRRAARRLLAGRQAAVGRLWLVRRRDLLGPGDDVVAVPVTVPHGVAHLVADLDDDGDVLTLHVAHGAGLDLAEWLRADDRQALRPEHPVDPALIGMVAAANDRGRYARLNVHAPTGRVLDHVTLDPLEDDDVDWTPGLPAARALATAASPPRRHPFVWWFSVGLFSDLATAHVHRLYAGAPDRRLPADAVLARLRGGGVPSRLFRLDTDRMAVADRFVLPEDTTLSSPQWIPRPGHDRPEDGWMSVVVWTPERPELWIFDAARLSAGPVVVLSAPGFDIGFCMHAAWTPGAAAVTTPLDPSGAEAWAARARPAMAARSLPVVT